MLSPPQLQPYACHYLIFPILGFQHAPELPKFELAPDSTAPGPEAPHPRAPPAGSPQAPTSGLAWEGRSRGEECTGCDRIHRQRSRNETKNVPKNFGKAIIAFIQQNEPMVGTLCAREGVSYQRLLQVLKQRKRRMNTIADLRGLWLDSQCEFARLMRTLSFYFLKRGSLHYVFGSKISNIGGHIRCRSRLLEFLHKPDEFTFMKS